MATLEEIKKRIKNALRECGKGADFPAAAAALLGGLGYKSARVADFPTPPEDFLLSIGKAIPNTETARYFIKQVKSVRFLFQVTESEIEEQGREALPIDYKEKFARGNIRSFLFFAVELEGAGYTRSQYAALTREINKRLVAPSVIVFRCGQNGNRRVTLSFVWRRRSKTDAGRDVLGKVSLLREISCANPIRGHLDILAELNINRRIYWMEDKSKEGFSGLLDALLYELDAEALNRRFYDDLREWFERAVNRATFPVNEKVTKEQQVVRLISRLLFIWFMREKKLISENLFNENEMENLLKNYRRGGDSYYRAILQNLFFATLNTKKRKFRIPKKDSEYSEEHRDFSLYRYEDLIGDKEYFLSLITRTPFVNGGLFDCLDDFEGVKKDGLRVDCFTDNTTQRKELSVPNSLFFDESENSKGLFDIFKKYKFTVEENTPIEQEVALDPELLGKVFENLLVYVETRRETGSYYTPRVVVDYMVRESLTAYFMRAVQSQGENFEERVRLLLSADADYDVLPEKEKLSVAEAKEFVQATGGLRLLDPAVGSGAFPMGALQQMTMALLRVDPENKILKKQELAVANKHTDEGVREKSVKLICDIFSDKEKFNYARKLHLIRDCLFGVDIQPVAVQICRLRFFISLLIEQEINREKENLGILALPNMDTKIISGNTLVSITKPNEGGQGSFFQEEVEKRLDNLKAIRRRFFGATTRDEKWQCKDADKKARAELRKFLGTTTYPATDAKEIAKWNPYDPDAETGWFSPEWMFDGVDSGFHIVIGNPPYVKVEHHSEETKEELKKSFGWVGDLYDHFIFKSHELAATGGAFSYICNDSYVQFSTKKKIRKMFLENSVKLLVKCPLETFDATIYTAIFLAEKTKPAASHAYMSGMFSGEYYEYAELGEVAYGDVKKDPGVKFFYASEMASLYNKLVEKFCQSDKSKSDKGRLKDFVAVLDTGIDSGNVRKKIFFLEKEKESFKRLLQGKQINRYLLDWDMQRAKFKYCDIAYKPKPVLGIGRGGKVSDKLEYWQFRGEQENHEQPERLLMRQTADCFVVAYQSEEEDGRFYTDNTLFTLLPRSGKVNLKVVLGILNSKLMLALYQFSAQEKGKVLPQVKTKTVKNMPFVMPDEKAAKAIAGLAQSILDMKAEDANADTSQEEAEIDKAVYTLYELTPEEVAIIEGAGQ